MYCGIHQVFWEKYRTYTYTESFGKNDTNVISSQFANKLTTLSDRKSASFNISASVIGNYPSVAIAR